MVFVMFPATLGNSWITFFSMKTLRYRQTDSQGENNISYVITAGENNILMISGNECRP